MELARVDEMEIMCIVGVPGVFVSRGLSAPSSSLVSWPLKFRSVGSIHGPRGIGTFRQVAVIHSHLRAQDA